LIVREGSGLVAGKCDDVSHLAWRVSERRGESREGVGEKVDDGQRSAAISYRKLVEHAL
jgi:hypothetical protein